MFNFYSIIIRFLEFVSTFWESKTTQNQKILAEIFEKIFEFFF